MQQQSPILEVQSEKLSMQMFKKSRKFQSIYNFVKEKFKNRLFLLLEIIMMNDVITS